MQCTRTCHPRAFIDRSMHRKIDLRVSPACKCVREISCIWFFNRYTPHAKTQITVHCVAYKTILHTVYCFPRNRCAHHCIQCQVIYESHPHVSLTKCHTATVIERSFPFGQFDIARMFGAQVSFLVGNKSN